MQTKLLQLALTLCWVCEVNSEPPCKSPDRIMQRLSWRSAAVTVWGDLCERFCTHHSTDSLPSWWRWLMKARHLFQQLQLPLPF